MREIKFRGRYVFEANALYPAVDEWKHGYLYYENGDPWIKNALESWKVVPGSEGQYTGLKDKNDTEIYEGDWLRVPSEHGSYQEVIHSDGAFRRKIKHWDITLPYPLLNKELIEAIGFEVIGNIHENPELLAK